MPDTYALLHLIDSILQKSLLPAKEISRECPAFIFLCHHHMMRLVEIISRDQGLPRHHQMRQALTTENRQLY